MIHILDISISGKSKLGQFGGTLSFEPGLQIISARNRYGKSLAVTAISWCLGLERMFGLQDNDPSQFSGAVRDVIELKGHPEIPVLSSQATLTLERGDGERLQITRAIRGDSSRVQVREISRDGDEIRSSTLLARKQTMKDETAGFQRFLFAWCGLPRTPVIDIRGESSELYLENIAPLFHIDQTEGWTDIQALQVHRYGLLEVSDIVIEYLLGATEAIENRFLKQSVAAREATLKAEAAVISSRVTSLFQRQGWVADWTDHGSIQAIAKRWRLRELKAVLRDDLRIDLEDQRVIAQARVESLRSHLATGDLDGHSNAASSDSSQAVVELKDLRHRRREELRLLRRQRNEQADLKESVEHRLHSAKDILRLKTEGIGRLDVIECPTCHRNLDPSTFELSAQSAEAVRSHIEALSRDRLLVASNVASSDEQLVRLVAELDSVEAHLRGAERALVAVNQAVGASREQLTKAATDLVAAENDLERLVILIQDVDQLQRDIDSWLDRSALLGDVAAHESDLRKRVSQFVEVLRTLLFALGHGGMLAQSEAELKLDEHYVPLLGSRRLRSLGSASDHSRLVAAYVLALAAASLSLGGFHPGFVILDEPLQQNPDDKHRDLFIDFITGHAARSLRAQTIVFTWLTPRELERTRDKGVRVVMPDGEHFLELVSADS